ncbi:amino acid/amide ABC transporter ATP-binding protein 1, HAAT family [Paracoccus solventivorans]|uniref:Amino acid/amide ABC transporter ATP-binding protein 1, HAAT family n=1 Tax=Paracoccus solventivorans TaxID=53463 RepID=A0A1M7JBT8_9RHOB|nr:ABC transporter ATP-binding protein [Paracoccus solventivorans]SHM50489.1 amino acid/amide ABC transporter ATP-binding protein 1, HAAT family [Paracoccus solventivorans]
MTNVASAPLLQVDAITMRFGGIVAIDNLSLDVKQGQILALMGPNGAGKTTTFHVIAGVHKPTSGRILFQGQDITAMRPDGRCRAGVARTFQITQPFEQLSVTENIMVGARPFHHSMAELRKASEAFADQVGLGDRLDTPAKGLSTGQRKRLELARAMATRPKLLLMDEVTGGVDMKSIPGLIELVKSLRQGGLTIVLIEHNMKVINDLADEAIFMNRGARMVSGTPYQVATDPAVVELYLGEAKADDH